MSPNPLRRGLVAGTAAGAALVALMYLAGLLLGLRALPQLLQQPLLDLMPGAVFGFLIDNLQHAGKVLEEAGLIVAMIAALGALGAPYTRLARDGRLPHPALAIAASGWAVVVLVLLPVSGDGFLGLAEGPATPLLWAVLFGVYAVLLETAAERWLADPPPVADPGRRRLLALAPYALGGASLAVIGLRLVPGWYDSIYRSPEVGLTGPAPEITPVAKFYVVSKNFSDPIVEASGWALNIRGMVASPMRLDLAALRDLPAVALPVTLECISNNVGGNQISTGLFAGVALRTLLEMAGIGGGASLLAFKARDGYTETLPVSLVMASPEILVAHSLGGAPLTSRHGFPARILVPGHYGMKGPKWVEEILVTTGRRNGYWENQGWNPDAVVKTMARIDTPTDGALVRVGEVTVAGIAFAGKRGISAVEISSDGGRTWMATALRPPLSPLTWQLWSATWTPPREGSFTLQARARDGEGALQTANQAASYPEGSSGYHRVRVDVTR